MFVFHVLEEPENLYFAGPSSVGMIRRLHNEIIYLQLSRIVDITNNGKCSANKESNVRSNVVKKFVTSVN